MNDGEFENNDPSLWDNVVVDPADDNDAPPRLQSNLEVEEKDEKAAHESEESDTHDSPDTSWQGSNADDAADADDADEAEADDDAERDSSAESDSSMSELDSVSESDDDEFPGDGRLTLQITRAWRPNPVDDQ